MKDTVCDEFERIPVLVEDTLLRPFGDVEWAAESSPDINVLWLISTAVNRSVAEAF